MKICIEKFKENLRPIVQLVLIVFSILLPTLINASYWIKFLFENSEINFDTAKYYFLLKIGNWGAGIVLMFFMLSKVKNFNKEKTLNTRNVYHDYSYIWYWICAKILGYTKCNLKLVPIHMQFKLILNDTFAEYNVGSEEDYPLIENEIIQINKVNWNPNQEVNLVLADTYPISQSQMPSSKSQLPTLFINRQRPDLSRYYSPQFIATIVDEVRKLPSNKMIINVFSTTNAKHTKKIAENAFKLANRGNIKKLLVFQQNNSGKRKFEKKGKVIYNYLQS